MVVHKSISTDHKLHISPASPRFQACKTCMTRLCASSLFPLALRRCIARISEPMTARRKQHEMKNGIEITGSFKFQYDLRGRLTGFNKVHSIHSHIADSSLLSFAL